MSGHGDTSIDRDGGNLFLIVVGKISMICGWIAAAMIISSVAVTCQMIFVRSILNESTTWQTELVVYLMINATLFGLSYVQRLRGHVNVDLVPMMLPIGARRILALIVILSTIAIITIMAIYGYEQWHEAFSRNWKSDTVWAVRLWIPYLAVPIGFCLFLLQLLADLYATLAGIDRSYGVGSTS
ncbi:MAG: TRAP transporter small permease [Alphaproteobacteria bacterium]|nr:TRAP transporter small permease [Alphaproteobacteria bacterium]